MFGKRRHSTGYKRMGYVVCARHDNMFRDALVFNQDISASWKVSTTTDFTGAVAFGELRSQN